MRNLQLFNRLLTFKPFTRGYSLKIEDIFLRLLIIKDLINSNSSKFPALTSWMERVDQHKYFSIFQSSFEKKEDNIWVEEPKLLVDYSQTVALHSKTIGTQ